MIRLVDTHCHLTELTETELVAQLHRAAEAGVDRAVCIGAGYGVESAKRAVEIAERYPNVWASVGIHPHNARDHEKLPEIELLAGNPRVVAIGETGLDYCRELAPVDLQKKLFKATIELARKVRKPIIIHCRDAREDCFQILKENGAAEIGGVFHCYSEDSEFAERIKELNFIVSFPGSLTFKKADQLREVANSISLDRIMLETDSPYMAPEPYRGKPSEPAHVRLIAETLARVKGLSVEEIAAATTETVERVFGIK